MKTTDQSYAIQTQELRNSASIRSASSKEDFCRYRETLDGWRHERMFEPVRAFAEEANWSWLTIGDGQGWDAARLHSLGALDVTASDLTDAMLCRAVGSGLIKKCRIENCEFLTLPDDSIDVVFCKESFHHFPRPFVGLYEMIRVARHAVILIEPRDYVIDRGPNKTIGPIGVATALASWLRSKLGWPHSPCPVKKRYLLGDTPGYETSGNYIYTLSSRELEKISLGMNFPMLGLYSLNDAYQPDLVKESPHPSNLKFNEMTRTLERADSAAAAGFGSTSLLIASIFKNLPSDTLRQKLSNSNWTLLDLPRNPYLK